MNDIDNDKIHVRTLIFSGMIGKGNDKRLPECNFKLPLQMYERIKTDYFIHILNNLI